MDLNQADKSVNQSEVALIDWNTPPMVKNSTYNEDCIINNPFDMMESKASNMDPFDLVFYETPMKKELRCGNILSPLWELKSSSKRKSQCGDVLSPLWEFKSKSLRKSISLTDISGVAKILEQVKVDKFNNDHTPLVFLDHEVVDQPKGNCAQVLSEDKKIIIENEEQKINEVDKVESVLTVDHNNEIGEEKDLENLEKHSLCSEDEKKKIREQTRQRIQMLIEKGKKDYEEEYSRKSLFCTPIRNFNSSLNKSESLFNRGFLQSGSHIYDDNSSKVSEDISENDSNKPHLSPTFHDSELNSFDLNSLKPEWIIDNFSDSDSSGNVQIKDKSKTTELICNNNNDIDFKLKALNRIGIIESKPNACHVLKYTQNKKPQNKGPFLANVPLQQMVQNNEDQDINDIIHAPTSPRSQIKPVASSTPTANITVACKTPSTIESSIKSRPSITRRSISSVDSLNTPLNATKCFGKNTTHDVNENKFSLTNVPHSSNKRSNTTIVLCGEDNERKLKMAEITERLQSFKLNKSQNKNFKLN